MSATTRTQIDKPDNFQDFERKCAVWWEHRLRDHNLQRFGRNGQRQNGVDIYGVKDGDVRKGVGIQCKLKSGHSELTATEVKREFNEALKFRPKLVEFHILTTSPTDTKLQTLAMELSIEEADKGNQIRFLIWGWNSICDEVGRHQETMLAFDDSYGLFGRGLRDDVSATALIVAEVRDVGTETRDLLVKATEDIRSLVASHGIGDSTVELALALEEHLDAEIDGYRDTGSAGQWIAALANFTRLLERVREKASGRILFRVKANIGACHLNLNDTAEGVRWLLEAYDDAPTEPKAISNRALAVLLQEDFETVMEMGRTNLLSQVADPMLSSHVIQAARYTSFQGDPLTLVPEKDIDTAGVQIALALYQRARRDGGWRETAWNLEGKFADEPRARQLAAEATLEEIIGVSGVLSHAGLTLNDRARLEDVAKTLHDLWESEKEAEGIFDEGDIALCGNLILAYRAIGDFKSAMSTVRYALTIENLDDEFIQRAAITAMEAGDPIGREILPDLADGPIKNMLTVQSAVARQDWKQLSDFNPDDENYPESEIFLCQIAVRLAHLDEKPNNECGASLASLVDYVSHDVRASVLAAQFCKSKEQLQLASKAWENAMSGIGGETHVSGRLMAASYAFRNELWSDTAFLMYGHISTDHDNEEMRMLSSALVQERPPKQRAVDFFQALPAEIRTSRRYRYFEGIMRFNLGDLPEAERIFRDELESSPDLQLLGMLAMTLRRSNREPEIAPLLTMYEVEELDGSPMEKMTIAHELRRAGRLAEAFALAYPALRTNQNSAEVNLAYASLVFMSHDLGELIDVASVEVGTWVRLTDGNGKEFAFVFEEGTNDVTAGYLDSSHPIAEAAQGKTVGQEVLVPQALGNSLAWTVAEIKHRYLHAFHDVLENFQTKFPTANGLFSVTLKDDDISPVLEQVRLLSERGEKAVDLHTKTGIPIQLAAGLFHENPISYAYGVRDLDQDIKCCLGTYTERTAAFNVIENCDRRGTVLDAYAAWTAATLDVFDLIERILGPVFIAQSTLDDLLTFRGSDDFNGRSSLSLVHRGGETYKEERDAATVEARNSYVEQQIAKIERACSVVPAIAPNFLSSLDETILELCGERVMDPVFLCTGRRLLLSEDLSYRQLAAQAMNVQGVWLQSVLLYAKERGLMEHDRYATVCADLAALRHTTVALDARTLIDVVLQDPSDELRTLKGISRYIGDAGADYHSHIGVVREFVIASYENQAIDRLRRQRAMSILASSLIRNLGSRWVVAMDFLTRGILPIDRQYFHNWMRGHFLNPSEVYVRREAQERRFATAMIAALNSETETSLVRPVARTVRFELPSGSRSNLEPQAVQHSDDPPRSSKRRRRRARGKRR